MKKLYTKREISEYKIQIRDIMSCHGLDLEEMYKTDSNYIPIIIEYKNIRMWATLDSTGCAIHYINEVHCFGSTCHIKEKNIIKSAISLCHLILSWNCQYCIAPINGVGFERFSEICKKELLKNIK